MLDPTPRQLEILRVVVAAWLRGGPFPTLREIGAELGMKAPTGAHDQLVSLEKKGAITRRPHGGMGLVLDHPSVVACLRGAADPIPLAARILDTGYRLASSFDVKSPLPDVVEMRVTRGEHVVVRPPPRPRKRPARKRVRR